MQCHFCGKEIGKGRGILFVKANGVVYYFCSSKCKSNALKLKRKARKIKWTSAYSKEKNSKKRGKE